MGIKTVLTSKVVGRNLFNKYLLSIYYVPGTDVDMKNSVMNKTSKSLPMWSLYSSGGRQIISKIN